MSLMKRHSSFVLYSEKGNLKDCCGLPLHKTITRWVAVTSRSSSTFTFSPIGQANGSFHEVEILLKAGDPKTEVARLAGVSYVRRSSLQKKLRLCMSMMPPNARSGRSEDPAWLRISGNSS